MLVELLNIGRVVFEVLGNQAEQRQSQGVGRIGWVKGGWAEEQQRNAEVGNDRFLLHGKHFQQHFTAITIGIGAVEFEELVGIIGDARLIEQ